jgi:hypothetical protein
MVITSDNIVNQGRIKPKKRNDKHPEEKCRDGWMLPVRMWKDCSKVNDMQNRAKFEKNTLFIGVAMGMVRMGPAAPLLK